MQYPIHSHWSCKEQEIITERVRELQPKNREAGICLTVKWCPGALPCKYLLYTNRWQCIVEIMTIRFQREIKKDIYKTKVAEKVTSSESKVLILLSHPPSQPHHNSYLSVLQGPKKSETVWMWTCISCTVYPSYLPGELVCDSDFCFVKTGSCTQHHTIIPHIRGT